MADKEIYIDQHRVGYGTSVKGSPEIKMTTTTTFDGPKNSGTEKVPYSLEISKLICDNFEDYRFLSETLYVMRSHPKTITIKEDVISSVSGESFTVLRHYTGCLLDSQDYEMKPDEFTSETLKFEAENMNEQLLQ